MPCHCAVKKRGWWKLEEYSKSSKVVRGANSTCGPHLANWMNAAIGENTATGPNLVNQMNMVNRINVVSVANIASE